MKNSRQLAQEAIENFHKPNMELFAYWQGGAINLGYLLSARIDGEKRYIKSFETLESAIEYSHQYKSFSDVIYIHEQKGFYEMVYYWDNLGKELYL